MIVELPLRYEMRFSKSRIKTALCRTFQESYLLDIEEVDSEQAPLAGVLDIRDCLQGRMPAYNDRGIVPQANNQIHYRVARCGDGKVQLMAPIASAAWQGFGYGLGANYRPTLANTSIFFFPKYDAPLDPRESGIETVLFSSREREIKKLEHRSKQLLLIEGELWAACSPPGWGIFHIENGDDPNDWSLAVVSNPLDKIVNPFNNLYYFDSFIPFTNEHAPALENLRKLRKDQDTEIQSLDFSKVPKFGEWREKIPGILDADWRWHNLRCAIAGLMHPHADVKAGFMEEEWAAFNMLKHRLQAWPQERNTAIPSAALALARAMHSVRAQGMVENLDKIKECVGALRNSRTPPSLEERLGKAGIYLGSEETVFKP